METSNDYGTYGWVVAIAVAAIGVINELVKYYRNKNDNNTKVAIGDVAKEKQKAAKLEAQHNELLDKFNELEHKFSETERKLEGALLAFDIVFPLIKELIKDKPEYQDVFNRALSYIVPKKQ